MLPLATALFFHYWPPTSSLAPSLQMSLLNSFCNYRINVCGPLWRATFAYNYLLQWNLWTSVSLICWLSVFPGFLTLCNTDTVQMKSGSRRWRMHGLTRDTQSVFTLTLRNVQKAWQYSAHHWESTNRLHGNSSLANAHTCHTASPPRMPQGWYFTCPLCFLQKTHRLKLWWATGPGEVLHKHTHALTYTHVAHTQTELMKHENLKSQHANPVCLWDFFFMS